MDNKVLIQIWKDEELLGETEVDLDENEVTMMDDAFDAFQDAIVDLDQGESFTLIADRI